MEEYLKQTFSDHICELRGAELINAIVADWEAFTIFAKSMEKSFEYLNRFYLKNSNKDPLGEIIMSVVKR